MKGVEVGWGSHHASNCIKETDGHHRPHHKRRKPSERHESLVKRLHASVAYWWWWPTPTQALRPYLLSPNPLIRLIPISNQIWGIRPYGLSEGTVWELGFKYIEKEPIGNSIMKCGGEPAGMAGPEVRRMSELHMIVVVLDVRTSRPDNIPKGCFDFLKHILSMTIQIKQFIVLVSFFVSSDDVMDLKCFALGRLFVHVTHFPPSKWSLNHPTF